MTKIKKQPQTDKFKELAKELECNEDEKTFDEKLKKVTNSTEKPEK
jgi:hypothetical protein